MKYKCIYADPPWHYNVWGKKGEGRSAGNHYPTMSYEEIENMGVGDIADKDCALFLWALIPSLPTAISLVAKWGFEYKTVAFVWVKRNRNNEHTNFWGMGHWTRSNIEVVLLATKGSPKRTDKGVHQIIETFEQFETETLTHKVGRHSAKPNEARRRVEQLIGAVPKVELFARERHPGWDAFGNEIVGSIEIPNAVITRPYQEPINQEPLF